MLTESERQQLHKVWLRTKGQAWEPPNPRHEMITRLVSEGYLKRVDGRFLFERFKDSMLDWTDAGRQAMEAIDAAVAAVVDEPAPEPAVRP